MAKITQEFKDFMQSLGVDSTHVDMMTNIVENNYKEYRKESQEKFNREFVEQLRLMRQDIYTLAHLKEMIKEAEQQLSEVLKKKREAKNYIPVKTVERQKDESKKTVTEQKIYNFRL